MSFQFLEKKITLFTKQETSFGAVLAAALILGAVVVFAVIAISNNTSAWPLPVATVMVGIIAAIELVSSGTGDQSPVSNPYATHRIAGKRRRVPPACIDDVDDSTPRAP